MKKIYFLLIPLLIQTNTYISTHLLAEKNPTFSFDDFLKQLESEQKNSVTQEESKQITQNQSNFSLIEKEKPNKNKKLEQEIINVLEKQIKPLANDLSKIVEGPEAKKALAEKKKQHEQKQKEADRRLEQMRRQKPSSYYPSYRSPSSSYGRDWSPKYGGRSRSDYSSGYSGYSPKSYWDKYRNYNKEYPTMEEPETKSTEDHDKKGVYKTEEDKDVKKSLTTIKNLTEQIQAILSNQLSKGTNINIKNLATGGTFTDLNDKFLKREDEFTRIPEKSKNSIIPMLNKEKSQWKAFLPHMVKAIMLTDKTPDSSEMKASQDAGKELLRALVGKDYLHESSVTALFDQREKALVTELKKLENQKDQTSDIKSEIDRIIREASKIPGGPKDPMLSSMSAKLKSKDETKPEQEEEKDPMTRIKALTQKIKNLIGKTKKNIKTDATDTAIAQNKKFYRQMINGIKQLFEEREKLISELENSSEDFASEDFIARPEEQKLWQDVITLLLQAISYTPDLKDSPALTSAQKKGADLLSKLQDEGYIEDKKMENIQEKFEADLINEIEKTKEDSDTGKRLKKMCAKLPDSAKSQKLKDAKFK